MNSVRVANDVQSDSYIITVPIIPKGSWVLPIYKEEDIYQLSRYNNLTDGCFLYWTESRYRSAPIISSHRYYISAADSYKTYFLPSEAIQEARRDDSTKIAVLINQNDLSEPSKLYYHECYDGVFGGFFTCVPPKMLKHRLSSEFVYSFKGLDVKSILDDISSGKTPHDIYDLLKLIG
jgi:hypothetical protein